MKKDQREWRRCEAPLGITRLSDHFICTFCVLPSACDFAVHGRAHVNNGDCVFLLATSHHAHALCVTFLPPKSVAKSKKKHHATKRVATNFVARAGHFLVLDIWGRS